MSIPGASSTSHNATPTHQQNCSTVAPTNNISTEQHSMTSVTFSSVQIFEFDQCLGCNPPTSGSGPSISLGDSCLQSSILSIDDYENIQFYNKRSMSEMRMPCYLRFNIATKLGYPTSEIHANVCEMKYLRSQRENTAMKLSTPNGFMMQNKIAGTRSYSQSPREIFTRSNPLDGGKICWKKNRNYCTRRKMCLHGYAN